MDRKIFELYLRQRVKVRMKNNWKHEGILLNILGDNVLIADDVSGETWINMDAVMTIQKTENGRD